MNKNNIEKMDKNPEIESNIYVMLKTMTFIIIVSIIIIPFSYKIIDINKEKQAKQITQLVKK